MKRGHLSSPYVLTGAVFLAITIAGAWLWDWGGIAFSYLLLIYCLVAIGIRLDEIVARMDRLDARRHADAGTRGAPSVPNGDAEEIHTHQLDRMLHTLEHIADQIDRIADRRDE